MRTDCTHRNGRIQNELLYEIIITQTQQRCITHTYRQLYRVAKKRSRTSTRACLSTQEQHLCMYYMDVHICTVCVNICCSHRFLSRPYRTPYNYQTSQHPYNTHAQRKCTHTRSEPPTHFFKCIYFLCNVVVTKCPSKEIKLLQTTRRTVGSSVQSISAGWCEKEGGGGKLTTRNLIRRVCKCHLNRSI